MSEPPYAPQYRPDPQYRADPRQPYPPGPQPYPPAARRPDPETDSQVRAAMAARAELGPGYDEHIAAGLADRVEQLVAYRTAELRRSDEEAREDRADWRRGNTHRFVLGIISLGTGVPITAIAATQADGLLGVIAAWSGIVGVNAVFAWGNRRRSTR